MLPISDPILAFTILTAIILLAPLLAERFKIPDIVILLISGILIGPHAINLLESASAINLLGSIGLLYIMFLAGLEIDPNRFFQTGLKSLFFGICTFAVPQGVGMLVGRYLLGFNWTASVLLASMFASHTLLSYPIANRLGITRTEPVSITVGASIITNILALLILAVIADSCKGVHMGLSFWIKISLGIILLMLLIYFGLPQLARWFFRNVTEEGIAQFLFVLFCLCACAYISYFAKLEPIIGAFIAGIAFNRLIPPHSTLMNRVEFVGKTIFIPFFLISVGMLVDPVAIVREYKTILVSFSMVFTVIITKYIAAWLTGTLFSYDKDEKNVMFGLSVVQAAATLAAVIVGYNLGIFDSSVVNGAIAMIAITCPLGAFTVEKFGRRMAAKAPSPAENQIFSEQRMLVPVANPKSALNLLDLAFCIRNPKIPGQIDAISIVNSNEDENAVLAAEKLLANCLKHANSAEMHLVPSVRIAPNLADGIIRSAKELRSTMVLFGWPGAFSARDVIFGSLAETLIDNCPQILLFNRIVRPINTTRRLLVLAPPLPELRFGIKTMLSGIKYLSTQIGCDIKIFLSYSDSREFRKMADSAPPHKTIIYEECATMSEARMKLVSQISADDMILILAERRKSTIWSPGLDRLAETIAEKFPQNNIQVHYPRMPEGDDDSEGFLSEESESSFQIKACYLGSVDGVDAALNKIVSDCLAEPTDLAVEAKALLRECAASYPLKLCDKVILLHAHCEHASEQILIASFSEQSFLLPDKKTEVKNIIILINPKSQHPSAHLNALAKIGRIFDNKELAAKIANSKSADEFISLLKEGFI